jgi:hypothetical protein
MAHNIRQPNLYIYTRKIFSINNQQQNCDLIPKLFHNQLIYSLLGNPNNQAGIALLNTELINIRQSFAQIHPNKQLNKVNIYEYLLTEYQSPNLRPVGFQHLEPIYWRCIIEILQGFVDYGILNNSANNIPEIDLFITHLLRAHEDMRYGLYFSFKYAYDDDEFYRYALQQYENKYDIVYFTTISNILDYVESIKSHYIRIFQMEGTEFQAPLLYANNGWAYGEIEDDSVVLDGIDMDTFFSRIFRNRFYNIQQGELIYQFPLPLSLFRSILLSQQIRELPFDAIQNKYLKYKEKYLKLKKRLELK